MTIPVTSKTFSLVERAILRLYEQGLLIVLIALVVWALLDKARDVRSAAELGGFRQSLAALRIALVLDSINPAASRPGVHKNATINPFLMLENRPANYAGEALLTDVEAGLLAPGNWFFDKRCACVGYFLNDNDRFFSRSGSALLIFSLSAPDVLIAREPYVWRGELVN